MTTEQIAKELQRIAAAAGSYACSDGNPCGLMAFYDEGEEKPWRIADDWVQESFATADEAARNAAYWAEQNTEAN